jgi:hypothetical protein
MRTSGDRKFGRFSTLMARSITRMSVQSAHHCQVTYLILSCAFSLIERRW